MVHANDRLEMRFTAYSVIALVLASTALPALAQTLDGASMYRNEQEATRAVEDQVTRWKESQKPHTAIPYDPKQFDEFVGTYEITPVGIFHIYRDGNRFFVRETGTGIFSSDTPLEIYPQGSDSFFSNGFQLDFKKTPDGNVSGFTYHYFVIDDLFVPKVADSVAAAGEAALKERIRSSTPSSEMASALRRSIDGLLDEKPIYDSMTQYLATRTRQFLAANPDIAGKLGALKSIKFENVDHFGGDNYEVIFEKQKTEWRIMPLTPDGKIFSVSFHYPRSVGATVPAAPRKSVAPYLAPPNLDRS